MLSVLSNHSYRRLFAAQVIALTGTGLATVALGLLAWELAGGNAGQVLGTALAIKMLAYVILSPLAQAFSERVSRLALLAALNLIRAALAAALPLVTEVWQIYALIFLLQAASAAFTPAFQASIADVLADTRDYTKALSLSRLAYDLESLLSPLLAAALLSVVSFPLLFAGTAIGFIASAILVLSVLLPVPQAPEERAVWVRITRGSRIYLATPRLRALLALSFSTAAAGAVVLVNTVVLVRSDLGLSDAALALTLAAFGAGSMLAALALPRVLEAQTERRVMLSGAAGMTLALAASGAAGALYGLHWPGLLTAWLLIGAGYSATVTPAGRLLRRSGHAGDRPALFAAQFALSHACWLITYPLAGALQAAHGSVTAMLTLALLSLAGLAAARALWPRLDPVEIAHTHDDLPAGHPHIAAGPRHSHAYVIDTLHRRWPDDREMARGV